MKFIKRSLLVLLIVVFLLGTSVFVVLTFYKREIATLLTNTLKSNYKLTLKAEDVKVTFFSNWPQVGVELKNVSLTNDFYKETSEPFLKAGSLTLSFNIQKLLFKQFIVQSISVNRAEINLIRNKTGLKNFEFMPQPIDNIKPSAIIFQIDKISVQNTKFNFTNYEKKQNMNILFMNNVMTMKHYADGIAIKLKGNVLFGQLLFNAKKGAFLKYARASLDLQANYFKEKKTVCVHAPSSVEIENQEYKITSLIQTGEEKRLALYIESKNCWYEKVARLLSPKIQKILSNFEIKKPLNVNALVIVTIGKREDPILIVNVDAKNSDLTIGKSKIPYSNITFSGKIISIDSSLHYGNAEKARINFKPVKGLLYDFPFTAAISVVNLKNPWINIEGTLLVDASKIKTKVKKEFILKGMCFAKLNYSGPTEKLNKEHFLNKEMKLKANVVFSNFSYQEIKRPYQYIINGNATISNDVMNFEKLFLKTVGGDAVLRGSAQGIISYVVGNSSTLKASLSAKTENFNFNPYLLKPIFVKPKKSPKDYKTNIQNNDESQFEFDISLQAKKLILRKVDAQNANLEILYRNNFLCVKSASMLTCDGKIIAKGTLENFNKITSEVLIENMNVNGLFKQFENFGQNVIAEENLEGTIFIDAKFKALLDDNMEVIAETMDGEVKLRLKDGHLLNFEPVQNISNFIFRNRNFNDISFTELKENFKVHGYDLLIEELEIASNVLNLYVLNGVYSFKKNSNINVLIPWSNLKRRGKNYIPKSSEENAENSKGLKLNFSGKSNKMKISLGHKTLNGT